MDTIQETTAKEISNSPAGFAAGGALSFLQQAFKALEKIDPPKLDSFLTAAFKGAAEFTNEVLKPPELTPQEVARGGFGGGLQSNQPVTAKTLISTLDL